jgi:hypothetical protein
MREPDIIKGLFKELIAAPLQQFPNHRSSLIAPMEPGVYVIYGRNGKILHVGRTPRACGLSPSIAADAGAIIKA